MQVAVKLQAVSPYPANTDERHALAPSRTRLAYDQRKPSKSPDSPEINGEPLCTVSKMATVGSVEAYPNYRGPYEFALQTRPASGSGIYFRVAIPFIKHTPVGKSTQAKPYTASAHLRYISRKANTHHIEADGMPKHYWAAQDFLDEREDKIRKNGRVCDKFIIALPNEMTLEQGVDTVRQFGNKLCRFDEDEQRFLRGSYYFTLQDHGTKNFHCHFIYVDADRESGERPRDHRPEQQRAHQAGLGRHLQSGTRKAWHRSYFLRRSPREEAGVMHR